MPKNTRVLNNGSALKISCEGHVSLCDFSNLDVDKQTVTDESNQRSVLIDLAQVKSTDMAFSQMNALFGKLERHYQARCETLRLIIFAPSDLAFGMSRMLETISSESGVVQVEIYRECSALTALALLENAC